MDKYIICTVGTSIANDCPEQKNLFKSQAGWDADGTVIKRQLAESIKKRSPALKSGERNFRALCAELNTLDRLHLTPHDRILLIASDNLLGNVCSAEIKSIISTVYAIPDANIEISKIDDLQIADINKLRRHGLKNLISKVLRKMEDDSIKYRYEIIFNPVGGYKFILPFIAILAMLYGKKSIYLFEYSEELLQLPALPFSFDTAVFNRVRPAVALIDQEVAVPEEQFLNAIIGYSPSEHDMFMSFTEPYEDKITLSPLAYCFMKIDENKSAAKISVKAQAQLERLEGTASGQAVKRIIKNAENPTWRNTYLHSWKTSTDLKVLRCGSSERVACFVKKGVIYIVEIFSNHDEYERRMPQLSEETATNETFIDCDFDSEDLGTDDTDTEGVYEERNRLQIDIKELRKVIVDLQTENKNSAATIELRHTELQSQQAIIAQQNRSIEELKQAYTDVQTELNTLKRITADLQKEREKQESFIYRLTHLFGKPKKASSGEKT